MPPVGYTHRVGPGPQPKQLHPPKTTSLLSFPLVKILPISQSNCSFSSLILVRKVRGLVTLSKNVLGSNCDQSYGGVHSAAGMAAGAGLPRNSLPMADEAAHPQKLALCRLFPSATSLIPLAGWIVALVFGYFFWVSVSVFLLFLYV